MRLSRFVRPAYIYCDLPYLAYRPEHLEKFPALRDTSWQASHAVRRVKKDVDDAAN